MTTTIGVDLGGTNIAAALLDEDWTVVDRAKVRTPTEGPEAVVEAIVGAIGELDGTAEVVGVGAPGPVDADGVVVTAPNLEGWNEPVPLAAHLSERLDASIAVANDVTAGATGEWVAGSGEGATALLGVWLGTGVGGGLVLGGAPWLGANGGAGEFGHIPIRPRGALCGCGRRGCVEAYAGRRMMERQVADALARGESTLLEDIRAEKGKARYTSGVWAKAIEREDPLATKIFGEAIEAVALGCAAAINLLDLDRVVVGGGFAEKLGQPLVDRIAEAALPAVLVPEVAPAFVVAALGDDSGVVGAAALALRQRSSRSRIG